MAEAEVPMDPNEHAEYANSPDVLSGVEARLVAAETPEEVSLWARVRGEVLQQDEIRRAARSQRILQYFHILSAIGLSVGAFGVATGLIIANHQVTACFLLFGTASYRFVPDGLAGDRSESGTALRDYRSLAICASLLLVSMFLLVAADLLESDLQRLACEQVLVFLCGLFAIATLDRLQVLGMPTPSSGFDWSDLPKVPLPGRDTNPEE